MLLKIGQGIINTGLLVVNAATYTYENAYMIMILCIMVVMLYNRIIRPVFTGQKRLEDVKKNMDGYFSIIGNMISYAYDMVKSMTSSDTKTTRRGPYNTVNKQMQRAAKDLPPDKKTRSGRTFGGGKKTRRTGRLRRVTRKTRRTKRTRKNRTRRTRKNRRTCRLRRVTKKR